MTPRLLHHFARWGIEVHVGSAGNSSTSKSEVLLCAAARASCTNPSKYDGAESADLSDIIQMPGGSFMRMHGQLLQILGQLPFP
jgi:hypothetical protein